MVTFPKFSLDGDGYRILVLGATGEVKTVNAYWQLSRANFHEMPWFILASKGDPLIKRLEAMGVLVIYDARRGDKKFPEPTTVPGLYIIRPLIEQEEEVNNFLAQVRINGKTGLWIDEGFLIPQKARFSAYNNLLAQGRTLNIPMIMLYQRPFGLSQLVTSQSEFWAVYHLRKPDDMQKVDEYIEPAH